MSLPADGDDLEMLSDGDNDLGSATDDTNHPSLPPKKRRRSAPAACPSSAVVPAATKRHIIEQANRKCWLCGLFGKHVAHVIAKADTILFEEYKRTGLLRMPSLHAVENLIYLCAGCHDCFDQRVPVWTFLPSNLESFLADEEDFQTRRAAAAAAGQVLHRSPVEMQSIPYARYQIRRGHIFTQVFRKQRVKHWTGNPIAAIIRSASILSGMERLDPERRCGLPDDVAVMFQRLLYLYGTPPPKVIGNSEVLDNDEDGILGDDDSLNDSFDDVGNDGDNGPRKPDAKPAQHDQQPKQSRAPAKHQPSTHQPSTRKHLVLPKTGKQQPSPPTSDPVKRKKRPREEDPIPESRWRFGPHMTSDMLITWCRNMRDN